MGRDESNLMYHAVVNEEEQYSLWPVVKPIPAGWRSAGKTGTKLEVLEFIDSVWTDIRPLSVRRHIEGNRFRMADPEK